MKILGLSGRKQCGKNTTANFLIGLQFTSLSIVRGKFIITPKGQLRITDLFGDEEFAGIFDIQRDNECMQKLRENHIDMFVKLYSFADPLKRDLCMGILGLSRKQCYGTDDEKNTETQYRWENMPGVISHTAVWNQLQSNNWIDEPIPGLMFHEPGPMTGREVMQYVGTDIIRRMNGNAWVDATIRRMQEETPQLALVCDVRFPNEVEGIQNVGGKVMRLTRNPFGDEDAHESETALDEKNYDWNNFDWVVDNADVSIPRHCQLIYEALSQEDGWVPEIVQLEDDNDTNNLSKE